MKSILYKYITVLVLIVSVILLQSVQAQNRQMNEDQMRQMMQNAQKMQQCFANIDQSAMEALTARGKKVEAEVKALCKSGKRDQAQKRAMAYGRELNTSKEMQAMRKCGNMAQQMMKNSPWMTDENGMASGNGHICDQF